VPLLQSLGREQVYVAVLADDDVDENEAARRLGNLLGGPGLTATSATTGRVNLIAEQPGLLKVNIEGLLAFNDTPGITLATLAANTVVQPKTMAGTIKIIPYGVPVVHLTAAEQIAQAYGPLVVVAPFIMKRAVLITTGSESAQAKVTGDFTPALQGRLADYGASMLAGPYVPETEAAISRALNWALEEAAAELVLVAGETSIMDDDDITPRAIKAMGGEIVHYGMPVEPGNLLLLAYWRNIPIVGAPGCARSRSYNVVDRVLPRLAAGERLTRRDLIALGHGGLLK
jgi:molybdopterin biosynthesis enzyme